MNNNVVNSVLFVAVMIEQILNAIIRAGGKGLVELRLLMNQAVARKVAHELVNWDLEPQETPGVDYYSPEELKHVLKDAGTLWEITKSLIHALMDANGQVFHLGALIRTEVADKVAEILRQEYSEAVRMKMVYMRRVVIDLPVDLMSSVVTANFCNSRLPWESLGFTGKGGKVELYLFKLEEGLQATINKAAGYGLVSAGADEALGAALNARKVAYEGLIFPAACSGSKQLLLGDYNIDGQDDGQVFERLAAFLYTAEQVQAIKGVHVAFIAPTVE